MSNQHQQIRVQQYTRQNPEHDLFHILGQVFDVTLAHELVHAHQIPTQQIDKQLCRSLLGFIHTNGKSQSDHQPLLGIDMSADPHNIQLLIIDGYHRMRDPQWHVDNMTYPVQVLPHEFYAAIRIA